MKPDVMADERGAVQLTDIVLTLVLMVSLMVLAPIIFEFTALVSTEADPLSTLILQLVAPLFFIALILSVGVSARRRI